MTDTVKNMFDVINNINSSKDLLEKQTVLQFGNVYMVNRAMSNNFDTVFFADEASGMKSLDPWTQYLFYFHSVVKKKRFGKWEKKGEKIEDVKFVMDFYQVSYKKALEYMEILSSDELKSICDSFSKGGKTR